MKLKFIFKWFDLWVGFFWDRENKWLYFLPFPMLGVIFKFSNFDLPSGYTIEKIDADRTQDGKAIYIVYHRKGEPGEMQLDNCSTYCQAYVAMKKRMAFIKKHTK